MPSISNVQLTIQTNHADLSQGSPRRVDVSFTTSFNATEMFAHVVYKAEVYLRSATGLGRGEVQDDTTGMRAIGSKIITSASNQVQTNISGSLLRVNLNEDSDTRVLNGNVIDYPEDVRDDEWVAEVKLMPHIFSTTIAQSPQVVGSWGIRGQD